MKDKTNGIVGWPAIAQCWSRCYWPRSAAAPKRKRRWNMLYWSKCYAWILQHGWCDKKGGYDINFNEINGGSVHVFVVESPKKIFFEKNSKYFYLFFVYSGLIIGYCWFAMCGRHNKKRFQNWRYGETDRRW